MPRRLRFNLLDLPQHIVQRGHNRDACFFGHSDYEGYKEWLDKGARHYGLEIHAYCLMTNHTHLLATPRSYGAISNTMVYLGRHFVGYINHTHARRGSLWEGRYKACLVQTEHYLLNCYRYIETNPVSAQMVVNPEDYPWSSYRANALGEQDALLTPHPDYLTLGDCPEARQANYRALFGEVDVELNADLEAAITHNYLLGDERFKAKCEQILGRKIGNKKQGRPIKGK